MTKTVTIHGVEYPADHPALPENRASRVALYQSEGLGNLVANDCTAPKGRRHLTNDPKYGNKGHYATFCGRSIEAHSTVSFNADTTWTLENLTDAEGGAWNTCTRCAKIAKTNLV